MTRRASCEYRGDPALHQPGALSRDWRSIDDKKHLLEGIIDSVGLIELVDFLEEHFAVTIDDVDLTSRNLNTVSTIARPVEERAKVR